MTEAKGCGLVLPHHRLARPKREKHFLAASRTWEE